MEGGGGVSRVSALMDRCGGVWGRFVSRVSALMDRCGGVGDRFVSRVSALMDVEVWGVGLSVELVH